MKAVQRNEKESYRHQRNIDSLMACTACLVCFISTVNGHSKKKIKKAKKCGARSRQITNLQQSIYSFDIYGRNELAYLRPQ
jgi:hypothetical protein